MIRIDDDQGTHERLEALARLVDLPVCDIVRTLSYARFEALLQLSASRVMSEERERGRPAALSGRRELAPGAGEHCGAAAAAAARGTAEDPRERRELRGEDERPRDEEPGQAAAKEA